MTNVAELLAEFTAARGRLAVARQEHRVSPPDAEAAAVEQREGLITGPFLFGDFDHLKETHPAGYEAERLKACAAEDRKIVARRRAEERKANLARLFEEYTLAATLLAEAVAEEPRDAMPPEEMVSWLKAWWEGVGPWVPDESITADYLPVKRQFQDMLRDERLDPKFWEGGTCLKSGG